MSNELKPCPFCGTSIDVDDFGEPQNQGWEDHPLYIWECHNCHCEGPVATTLEGATDEWNNRTPIDPEQAIRDTLERHNDKLRIKDEQLTSAYRAGYHGETFLIYSTLDESEEHSRGVDDKRREENKPPLINQHNDKLRGEHKGGNNFRAGHYEEMCQKIADATNDELRAIKKPATIEFIEWTGKNHRDMFEFLGGATDEYINAYGRNFHIDHSAVAGGLVIKTKEGPIHANIGDMVIKETFDKECGFYPCNPDIFALTYDVDMQPRKGTTLQAN